MTISYRKLWKLLSEKGMMKKDLKAASGLSSTSIAKLGKDRNISTNILIRVCDALDCDISDICEIEKSPQ